MRIDVKDTAALLAGLDNVLILTHANPDGDTLGCGFALCRALLRMGKKVRVACSDEIPKKYEYMFQGMDMPEFEPEHIIAVDVADTKLIGRTLKEYKERIELCIDHHASNLLYAPKTLLDAEAGAAAEIIYQVIQELNVPFDKGMADCIYTGLSTDTGCFRYANATARTYRIAAEMIDIGADSAEINRIMFETKSKAYVRLEKMAMDTLELYFNDTCAVITLTQEMYHSSGLQDNESEGIAALPRQIEGVVVGVTLRERAEGGYKASVRTHAPVDASLICQQMGGGGHARAAGCQIKDTLENAKKMILSNIQKALEGTL